MAVDVAIIGGSQAGLALSYYLRQVEIDHVVIEAGQVGDAWEERWDSLTLFSSAQFSALPGTPFPTAATHYPTKDKVAAYLRAYRGEHRLPVREATAVGAVTTSATGFALSLDSGDVVRARAVVLATGAFGEPVVPSFAARLGRKISQVHSGSYHNPGDLPGHHVLVVGGGNSGFHIARELAEAGKKVSVAERTKKPRIPQRFLGCDVFWWMNLFRVFDVHRDSRRGRWLRTKDVIIGPGRRALKRRQVTFHPEVTAADKKAVTFADGSTVAPDAIVWATGFRYDDSWIHIPEALDENGVLITDEGHSPVAGLYTVGRVWQRERGSSLIGFVGQDAFRLATEVNHRLFASRP